MLPAMTSVSHRLWRLRKLHQSIDAVLVNEGEDVELRFLLNGELIHSRRGLARVAALEAAAARRADLEREGWMAHW